MISSSPNVDYFRKDNSGQTKYLSINVPLAFSKPYLRKALKDDGESEAYKKGAWTRWPLAVSSAKGAVTVTIGALEGAFAGVRERRSVRLELYFVDKPVRVTFDGKPLKESKAGPGWRMDAARSCLVVQLPAIPVRVEHGVWIQ